MTWEDFWNTVTTFFKDNGWNIVSFVLTLIIGIIVIKIAISIIKKLMRRKKIDEMAVRFITNILRFFLWLLLILTLLHIVGIPVTGITTALSAAVLAIGVALKDFLSNVASGIILVGSKKYKTGDYIKVSGDIEGSIVDINFLFTTLKTANSTQITLPNSTMVNSSVTDMSSYPTRRIAITFSVAYESDTKLVKDTLLAVMNSCGLVLKDPAPACRLKTLGESSIDFFCTCYCDNADYWEAYYYIMEHGFDECKRLGISFPFKQITVSQKIEVPSPIEFPEGLPERVEKKRVQKEKPLTLSDLEDMSLKEVTEKIKKSKKKKTTNSVNKSDTAKKQNK